MKTKFLAAIALPSLLLALSAQAHDQKEHRQDAQKLDCTSMTNMDHAKIDIKDPVMQAVMQQCMQEMHQNDAAAEESQEPAKHQHKK